MGESRRRTEQSCYLRLNNRQPGSTYPVSVDHSFLSDIFQLEKSYASDSVFLFRKHSHPLRKFHVTATTLRLVMTISRRFNTEGTLVGCPVHRLYKLMLDEYEQGCSKEQFYAEIHKFIELGLLSVSTNGIVEEWKLESYKRDSGRFILFHPVVFSQQFTGLPVAAQKLYLYIVSRNGNRVKSEFKEYLGRDSWIYTLTHKSRPAQIKELLDSLSSIQIHGERLFLNCSVEKDSLGRWSLRCALNPYFLVRHVAGAQYRMIPQAKIPYSKTVARLRQLVHYHKLGHIEQVQHGGLFLKLAQLLHNKSLRTLRFAVSRIRDFILRYGLTDGVDLVSMLRAELEDQAFVAYMEVLQHTGAYRYLGMAENEEGVETYAEARPLQFFRSIKDKLSLAELKRLCNKAVPVIRHRYGEKIDCDTFYLEDLLLELH
ncbi:hypothetical protein RAC89_28865 [Paenibacillus sp. GD4]|uniref:hypothetical protein n=1 Tax=Paenibacillus sp. GD4 TaxID=3068890 RepID=UPI002796CACA|nr:hypothetical protein [Paenibacillus sp. GD4]MDQ1914392.1 hypothetical protein [Paenibacillus sp. GD4]